MKFTSLDLEMNQPSGKIIQIGAVAYDTDTGEISRFIRYVDPGEEINWGHPLNNGQTLGELLGPVFHCEWHGFNNPTTVALKAFWEWHRQTGAGKKFIQWGRGDMSQLLKESQGLGYPSHLRVFDLKLAYQFFWQPGARLQKDSGLEKACAALGIPGPERPHDALCDAEATGRVFLKCFRQVEAVNVLLRGLE